MKHLLPILILLSLSCEKGWLNKVIYPPGCTEESACNYNPDASKDDSSCEYPIEFFDCEDNCIVTIDCEGVCNGTSLEDNCGVCDSDSENDCEQDCEGNWGGDAIIDECGICNGDNSYCADCNDVINGDAYLDNCGICVGGNTGNIACPNDCAGVYGGNANYNECGTCICNDSTPQMGYDCMENEECIQGCDGIWSNDDSHLTFDECNICGGDNTTCTDCNGDINGEAVIDECGTCDNNPENDCIQDCAGVWGGTHWGSDCGCVEIDNSGDDCDDCFGIPNGDAEILIYWYDGDNDGLGAGEPSEFCSALALEGWVLNNNDNDDNCFSNIHDCLEVCNGDATMDDCGTCNNNDNDDCLMDIDGNVYQTIQIGQQLWMSENLKTTHYNNGDEIPTDYSDTEWADLFETSTGAYTIYDGDLANAEIYGNLYNWYAVDDERGVCPEGWNVPSNIDWTLLLIFLDENADEDGWTQSTIAGGMLKSTGTIEGGDGLWIYENEQISIETTNESGFTALPAGQYSGLEEAHFGWMYYQAKFWTNQIYDYEGSAGGHAYNYILYNQNSNVDRGSTDVTTGMSIRCLKD